MDISSLQNFPKLLNENNIKKNNEIQSIPSSYKLIRRTYYQLIPIVQKILLKKLRKRTPKDISDLYEFLELTKFEDNMKDEIEEGSLDLQQLFFFSTQFMSFKTYNKNDIIYYEGDIAENIYVLIKGEVNLYKLQSTIKEMNSRDYYRYLYNIHINNNDNFLVNKTINANEKVFPIYKISDIPKFEDILFKIEFCELLYDGNLKAIKKFLRNHNKNIEDFEFDSIKLGEMTMDDYFQKILSSFNDSEDYYFTHVRNIVKKVKILSNNIIRTLGEKEYFGKFTLEEEGDIRRESAICAKDNTLILVINKKLYSGCITTEQKQTKENEIDKVYNGTLFMSIRRFNFDKFYFYNFEKIEYSKGEEIFSENEKIDYIYLLKRGSVEVNLPNKNILDIKKLIQKFKEFDLRFQKSEFDDTLKLKNSLLSLQSYIKVKNNYSLFICNTRETFGVWEYYYNNRISLYSIKTKSDKAILYRMPIEHFLEEKNINDKVPDSDLLKKAIKLEAYEQVKNNIERLIFLKNSVLMKIDFEYTKKKKDEEEKYIPKLNIFQVKNIMRPLNLDFKNNKQLMNILSHRQQKSVDLKHFNTNNNNYKHSNNNLHCNSQRSDITNMKRFLIKSQLKQINSLENIFKGKLKLNVHNDSFDNNNNNSKSIISIKNINKIYSRNIFIDKQFQNELSIIKNEMNKDSFLNLKDPFITEGYVLPKIKYPKRIQSPIFLKMKTDFSKDNINKRSHSYKNKEIFIKPQYNNSQKNINYLAIKEFYNHFTANQKKRKHLKNVNKSLK